MNEQRAAAVRQYVVFHLKELELLHLILLSFHLSQTKVAPENEMEHGCDRFKETLLGAVATAFIALADKPAKSTNARAIWKQMYPRHAKAIERVWVQHIGPGEAIMKAYRDQAGAHGDRLENYMAGKLGLFQHDDAVLKAIRAYMSLSLCLRNRQDEEQPNLASEIEEALLDVELCIRQGSFNREWLKEMLLIPRGNFRKVFY